MLTTTLNRIREHNPCTDGWKKLLKHLGKTEPDDEPITYLTILESNGFDDALWCCCAEEDKYAKEWRLYAVFCARKVQHLMTDPRSLKALDVAEAYAYGNASDEELWDALYTARSASRSASRLALRATSMAISGAASLSASAHAATSAASVASSAEAATTVHATLAAGGVLRAVNLVTLELEFKRIISNVNDNTE